MAVNREHEPTEVGRVAPREPVGAYGQTNGAHGVERPTFRFMGSRHGLSLAHWNHEPGRRSGGHPACRRGSASCHPDCLPMRPQAWRCRACFRRAGSPGSMADRMPATTRFMGSRLFLSDLLTAHEPTEFPHRFKATTDSFSFPIGGYFESEGRFKGRYGTPARRSPHFLARHSHHSLI